MEQCENEAKRENVRRSQSAVMNEIREHEVERRSVRSRQSVQTSRRSADNDTSFLVKFQARVFIAMSSEFKFGDNSDEFSIFRFFINLADRDITEYQITQTLTLS